MVTIIVGVVCLFVGVVGGFGAAMMCWAGSGS